MAAQYPPLATIGESAPEAPDATIGGPWPAQQPPGTEHDIDIDTLLDRIGDGRPSDLIRDTLWTYENLANRRIKASDAPTCGAWALLEWARQYRNRFFEQVLPKAMLNKPPEEDENVRREKTRIEDMKRILEELNQQWAEDLAANTPATVKAKVRRHPGGLGETIRPDHSQRSQSRLGGPYRPDGSGLFGDFGPFVWWQMTAGEGQGIPPFSPPPAAWRLSGAGAREG